MTLRITQSPEVAQDYLNTVPIDPGFRAPWELQLIVGRARPAHPIDVALIPPGTQADGRERMPFVQEYRSTDMEVHDAFEGVPSSVTGRGITFSLAPDAFTDRRRPDGLYGAIVVLSRQV